MTPFAGKTGGERIKSGIFFVFFTIPSLASFNDCNRCHEIVTRFPFLCDMDKLVVSKDVAACTSR
jgi:hypothetical protein